MCATIIRIEVAGPERRARRLVFDDGHDSRDVSTAIMRELALEVGTQIDPTDLECTLQGIELDRAKARALQLLGYRERSEAELRGKLVASGYPPGVANAVVARFVQVELVDDSRFAAAFARSKVSAGYGNRRIARELQFKGISESLVADTLETLGEREDDVSRARRALRGRAPADPNEERRLVRRLVARGFDLATALRAVGSSAESAGGIDA